MGQTSVVIRATWNWLWGRPINAGGEISAQVGEDSVDDVAHSFQQLVDSVGLQKAALAEAVRLYEETSQRSEALGQQAEQLVAAG
jgi:phage shock protein A